MPATTPASAPAPARIEAITGRYVHLELGGRAHRVYFEEAGAECPSSACTPRARTGASTAT